MTKQELLRQLEHCHDLDDIYVLVYVNVMRETFEPDNHIYSKLNITRVTTDQFHAILFVEPIEL